MKIVIDIPESIYDTIQADMMISREQLVVLQKHITNGTPLQKGHGRLIDADELKKIIKENDILYMAGFNVCLCDINKAPTIIEADKE